MNLPTAVVLILVAAAVFFAARRLWKNRGRGCAGCPSQGGCSGNCSSCGGCRK